MHYRIYPACLPIKQRTSNVGVHSGWSSPIPFHILSNYAPGYTRIYRDFFKQLQTKMDISDRCEDGNKLRSGKDAMFPSNTFYPPGKLLQVYIFPYDKLLDFD